MPTIEANGLSIAYADEGTGPPLILLHGATGSGSSHFDSLLPVVTRSFRVLEPDARGHGGTRWDPADGFAAADLVADLAAFADGLGLTTFHVLGYSMGAMTALAFAARRPARLRTLVIVGLGPEREPRLSVGRRLMDPERIRRDDPAWARENLRFICKAEIVDHNGPEQDYEDLRLMSLCRHHIIANSTFSWWGAWLSQSPDKKVIAPRNWFKGAQQSADDLLPPEWLRL